MKRLILAFQLLTRLPINVDVSADMKMYAGAAVFYPLCGLVVGLISLAAWALGVYAMGSELIGALLAAVAMTLVTGALHLDGLADSADGLLSSRTPERMLEIMKDSRMGVMGATALIFDIAARLIFVTVMGQTRGSLCLLRLAPRNPQWPPPPGRRHTRERTASDEA